MQDQRRTMPSDPVSPFRQTSYTDIEDDCSQDRLSWAPENSMPRFAANQFHASLQTSYDPSLNSLHYGPHHMLMPSYSASHFDPVYQPSYGPAPDSSIFRAYSTAALAPDSAFDQQLNTQDPGPAQLWDVPAMQLPDTAVAVPYSTANDKSNFPPTETLEFQGLDQPGFASPPTGTSSLPAAYGPHRADNASSWLDPAFRLSPVDTSSANDVECMTTDPASSSLGAWTE